MNILVFNGGTSNKNTKLVSETYKNICESRGHNVVLLDEYFKDCLNCQKCSEQNICCIKDSLTNTLSQKGRFDCITIATPIYFYHMSAKAKAFLDRLYCLDKENLIFSLLCVSGSTFEDSGIDLVEESIDRMCDYCNSYRTATFYKTTNDIFAGKLEDKDTYYIEEVIKDMEVLYSEIKEI